MVETIIEEETENLETLSEVFVDGAKEVFDCIKNSIMTATTGSDDCCGESDVRKLVGDLHDVIEVKIKYDIAALHSSILTKVVSNIPISNVVRRITGKSILEIMLEESHKQINKYLNK